MSISALILSAALAVLSTAARAQVPSAGTKKGSQSDKQGVPNLCAQDEAKLCPGLKSRALRECMQRRADALSAACRERIVSRASPAAGRPSCERDKLKFCPGVKPVPALFACMERHRHELSAECRLFRWKVYGHAETSAPLCEKDEKTFCPGVAPETALLECMEKHMAALTPECRKDILKPGAPPCMADRTKFCPSGTHDQVRSCLLARRAELSATCLESVTRTDLRW